MFIREYVPEIHWCLVGREQFSLNHNQVVIETLKILVISRCKFFMLQPLRSVFLARFRSNIFDENASCGGMYRLIKKGLGIHFF